MMTATNGFQDYIPAHKNSGRLLTAKDAFMSEAAELEEAELDLRFGNHGMRVFGNAVFEGGDTRGNNKSLAAMTPKEAFGKQGGGQYAVNNNDQTSNHSLDTNRRNSPDTGPPRTVNPYAVKSFGRTQEHSNMLDFAEVTAAPVIAKRLPRPPSQQQSPTTSRQSHTTSRPSQSPARNIKESQPPPQPKQLAAAAAESHARSASVAKTSTALVAKTSTAVAVSNCIDTVDWEAELKELIGRRHRSQAVTRPGPTMERGAVKCYVKRTKKMFSSYPVLQMYLENGDTFLLAARRRKKCTTSNYVISQDLSDLQRDTDNCIAKFKANFQGSEYMLYARSEEASARNGYSEQRLCLSYEADHRITNSGPRSLHVLMPRQESGWVPMAGEECLQSYLESACVNELAPRVQEKVHLLATKDTEYNEVSKSHQLDFRGRVKQASKKNMQLVTMDFDGRKGREVVLQFGKVEEDLYTLDFSYPFSVESAFAVALSALDTKLCYAV